MSLPALQKKKKLSPYFVLKPRSSRPMSRLDLYSLFRGTTSDVSALIDVIPSYLFPKDEKTIEGFWMTGISLGGQSSYLPDETRFID